MARPARRYPRKTAPGVVRGKVQKKNRSALTPDYYNTPQDIPAIDRQRPGQGYCHVLKKRDIVDFISILPDWEELSIGLNAILLAPGEDAEGWHMPGIVAVSAWSRKLWETYEDWYYQEHKDIFKRLEVPCRQTREGWECRFTEASVRGYQLLHILTHELGHHHDRMTTRSLREASRGEGYAEKYARRYERIIWDRYLETFGLY